jgi:hypothetical protein
MGGLNDTSNLGGLGSKIQHITRPLETTNTG